MGLKILQVAAFPFPSPQGSQVYVAGLSRALARRGHAVTLHVYGHGQGQPDPALRVVRAPRVPGYDRLRAGPDRVKPWLDLAMAAQLQRLVRGADLVHAHNVEAPLAAWPACRRFGVPLLYNSHTAMGEELHRYFDGPLARAGARWAGAALDRVVARSCDAGLALSEAGAAALARAGCGEVHLVPPGVDVEDFVGARGDEARARLGLGDRPWVVYAGNPDAYQDLDDLIDAVALLPELGLLMVSAADLSALEARAQAIPPARRRFVRAEGWAEVRDLIAAADLAALPRRQCAGFPIKLLNTLGLGLPTVCAQGSARPVAGVVPVPSGDVRAFAEALAGLAADPARRRALGAAARADVAARWSWAARARDLEQVYARVREGT